MKRFGFVGLIAMLAMTALAPASRGEKMTVGELLLRSNETMQKAKSVQISGTMAIQMLTGQKGQDFNVDLPVVMAMVKPNKFRYEVNSSLGRAMAACDGTTLWEYAPDLKQARISQAPGDISKAPDEVRQLFDGLSGLFGQQGGDSEKMLAEMAKASKYFGIRTLDGRQTHVVQSNMGGMFLIKCWIGVEDYIAYRVEMTMDMMGMMNAMAEAFGAEPGMMVPSKGKVTVNGKPVKPLPKDQQFGMKIVMHLKQVVIDQPIPAEEFKLHIPAGTKLVDKIKYPDLFSPAAAPKKK